MNEIAIESAQLPQEGDVLRVQASGQDIAVFRIDNELRAIDNICPHQGAALSDGWVEDGVVSCPWHCWQFDTKTGECLTVGSADVQTFPIQMRDGQAFLILQSDSSATNNA